MRVGLPVRAAWRSLRSYRLFAAIGLLLLAGWGALPFGASAQEWSAPRTVYIPTTGHTSDGLFLDVWRAEPDLLGDPVTEEFRARTDFNTSGDAAADVIQYYEHLALIYLPHESAEKQVQALDLGRQALAEATTAGRSVALQRALERSLCSPAAGSDCASVVATGHTLRDAFLAYWQAGDAATWLGLPLTESLRAPDGTRVQYFENAILRQTADGSVAPLPLGNVAARRAKIETKAIEQPQDVPVYDEELFIPPAPATPVDDAGGGDDYWTLGPGPQQGAWKEVVVSISNEKMWAYEGGELVMSSLVSTGTAETPEVTTPTGFFSVLVKYDSQTMEGTISGQHYRVEDVPYVMYFDNRGDALHGTYWHNNFGHPMSHGCVNLPMDVAAWMYDWAPVGTAVSVIW
ncbi:MAG TPA: L,D-transpeptidase [Thermomicrobiales bacterium]|nr:L,D-transpeptidase [Thermomicrobiales bacterium]